jgi:hypothetical protein
MVVAAGKFEVPGPIVGDTVRSAAGPMIGSCAIMRWLKVWGTMRNDAYEAALAALREDTQAWWADIGKGDGCSDSLSPFGKTVKVALVNVDAEVQSEWVVCLDHEHRAVHGDVARAVQGHLALISAHQRQSAAV